MVYVQQMSSALFYTSVSNGLSSHSCGTSDRELGTVLVDGSAHICHMT